MASDAAPSPARAPAPGLRRPLRVLLFSTLYPSSARPGHGQFIQTRLEQLLHSGQVEARVVAPVPWFPSSNPRYGDRALMAATPRREQWRGIDVLHPRYPLPPKVGQTVAPFALVAGAWTALRRLRREGFDFDVIDAHYYYPDGVAAAWLGQMLGKPVVITARGSDLNVLGRDGAARAMMRWAGRHAAASAGVCNALVETLRGWGLPSQRLHVVRNGVDLQRFRPLPRSEARARLGLDGAPLLISVGNLVPVKGHELSIDAVAALAPRLPGIRLVIVGRGPLRQALEDHARRRGVQDRVHFAGPVANEQLADWYSAADMSVLASHSEGWANVLLESMACGTPVVASDVGGSAEVIGSGAAGVLLARRDVDTLCQAILGLWQQPLDSAQVRRYAEQFSWDATTAAQLDIFRSVTGWRGSPTVATGLPVASGPSH
jgi:glycosyltransferase involved in cell wall biosynthesis